MNLTDTRNFVSFKLSDIAQLSYGNKFDKNKMSYRKPTINFVSRTSQNNGISTVVDLVTTVDPFPSGDITLAFGGSIGSTFLQTEPFYTGQNVGVIHFEGVSEESKLFICSIIEYTCKQRFATFTDEINKHFNDLSLYLPLKESISDTKNYSKSDIDWQFMEDFIKSLKAEYIQELEDYLTVQKLNVPLCQNHIKCH